MARFLFRRVVSGAVTLAVIITVTFFLMHMVPGGPFNLEKTTPVTRAAMEKKYGLDQPLPVQFARYAAGLVHFDFGPSLVLRGRTVNSIISEKLPLSAAIGSMALGVSIAVGLLLGVLAAVRNKRPTDRLIVLVVTLGMSLPGFIAGTILLVIFGVYLQVVPVAWTNQTVNYILPVLTYSFYPICFIARLTRNSMLDVLSCDYITAARAKGLSIRRVWFVHALKNAIVPVLAYIGPMAAFLMTGGLAIEKIFGIPGLGSFFVDSISSRDYPLIMGTTIVLSCIVLIVNLLTDLAGAIIDPRIRSGYEGGS